RGVRILGGLPLLPPGPMTYDLLLTILSRSFPDCGMIGMYGISTEGPLWQYLQHSRSLRDMFDVYVPYGIQLGTRCRTRRASRNTWGDSKPRRDTISYGR